ncbi:Protein of unknown function, partial [Gryllus bimaculatus]
MGLNGGAAASVDGGPCAGSCAQGYSVDLEALRGRLEAAVERRARGELVERGPRGARAESPESAESPRSAAPARAPALGRFVGRVRKGAQALASATGFHIRKITSQTDVSTEETEKKVPSRDDGPGNEAAKKIPSRQLLLTDDPSSSRAAPPPSQMLSPEPLEEVAPRGAASLPRASLFPSSTEDERSPSASPPVPLATLATLAPPISVRPRPSPRLFPLLVRAFPLPLPPPAPVPAKKRVLFAEQHAEYLLDKSNSSNSGDANIPTANIPQTVTQLSRSNTSINSDTSDDWDEDSECVAALRGLQSGRKTESRSTQGEEAAETSDEDDWAQVRICERARLCLPHLQHLWLE